MMLMTMSNVHRKQQTNQPAPMVIVAILHLSVSILPKALAASCSSFGTAPIQIDVHQPASSLVSIGCLDGTQPLFPAYLEDSCFAATTNTNDLNPICGQTDRVTTCKSLWYSSRVELSCSQGLYHIRSINGTTIGVPSEVWCVPSSQSSAWTKLDASFGSGKYVSCPKDGICEMTCGYDVDWCTSNEYANGCITNDPSFVGVFSSNFGSSSEIPVSIEDCLKQPPEYLKEVCRGIVPSEGGETILSEDTPSLSPHITVSDGFTTSTTSPSVITYESSVPMDSNTETEEGSFGTDDVDASDPDIPEESLSADPSNAIVHGDNVGTLVIMGVMAGYIFHI